jgi:WhiB family redox-sensing transcriptional regulator
VRLVETVIGDSAPWMRDGACLEHPEVAWFPERGETAEAAWAVCARCLVKRECADYAIRNQIVDGVWGGLSGREVRRARSHAHPPRDPRR